MGQKKEGKKVQVLRCGLEFNPLSLRESDAEGMVFTVGFSAFSAELMPSEVAFDNAWLKVTTRRPRTV